jgi:hypothetical protein
VHEFEIPEICRQQGRSITVNKTRETIHISRCNTIAKDSPCGKVSKPTDNDSLDDFEVDVLNHLRTSKNSKNARLSSGNFPSLTGL